MFLILFCLLFTQSFSLKTVTTSYGKLRGITDYTNEEDHKYVFKSVPFAKPPVGHLRFALPENPIPWNGILDASKYSPACLSNSSLTHNPQKYVSEDCLYVNIFTSEKCLKNGCPVIVYFHGGSFNLDSATMFPDKFILERYVDEGIVFVIPAYRLGVFGQFYLGDSELLPTNLLIYDCIQALNYVQDEIKNFGGNPHHVTLMGHSSGAQLVNALGFSAKIDPEKKLFHKIIALSSHGMFGFIELKIQNSFEIARRFNCSSDNMQHIIDCMREVNALDILQAQRTMEEEELLFKSIIRAPPIMDFNQKIADFKRNTPARKYLCGVSEHELEKYEYEKGYHPTGKFWDYENPAEVILTYRSNFTNMTSNLLNSDSSSVFVTVATDAEAMANAGEDVYLYETRQKPYSMHVSDMQYFIGIHRENIHTHDMDILDSFYSRMLVNFTKYGEPSPNWENLDPAKMNFLVLEIDTEKGIGPKMENGFHEELVDFWLIDMVELDENITAQKQHHQQNESISTSTASTVKIIYVPPVTSNVTSQETTTVFETELVTAETFPIYNQWWFYAIIIFIVIVATIVVLMILNKSPREDSRPLLA
ncbi:unnamed protein product [Caenorhabditis brenneri]